MAKEKTSEKAASAASKVLSSAADIQVIIDNGVKDPKVQNILLDFLDNAKSAAASALTQREPESGMPLFTIKATDNLSLQAISNWIMNAERVEVNPEKIEGALEVLREFDKWRNENPKKCKNPD